MTFKRLVLTAVSLIGLSQAAYAQSASATAAASGSSGVVAVVDVARLPIDMRRIERHFRETTIREERDGLNIRYFVDVYAKAPDIVLFTPQDNLLHGPVPYGAPTHQEMLYMMTPREFRASTMMLGSSLGVPRKNTKK